MVVGDLFVSVVIPLQNDADILELCVAEVEDVLRESYANYELVLVDDGSQDDTPALVEGLLRERKCVRYLRLSRQFGIEVAITAGLDSVIGDVVVILHPDMDPPALIPEIVAHARRCEGVAFGVPNKRVGEPVWSRVGRRLFHGPVGGLLGFEIPNNASQFQALSRNAINAVTRMRDKNRHLRLLSLNVGYAAEVYAYDTIQRRPIRRARGLLNSITLAVSLTVSNSTRPLRILSAAGVIASAANLLYTLVSFFFRSGGALEGMTLSPPSSLMFFLLFLILAALSEYIGRILDESRDRPLYHVIDERNSNVLVVDPDRRNIVTDSPAEHDTTP